MKALSPKTFADLVGHELAVAALSRIVTRKAKVRALVLDGPDGVGKHALAHVLAKAIVCEAPLEGAIACGRCKSCEADQLAITCFDGAVASDQTFKELTIEEPKFNTLLGQRVVIIDRPDLISVQRLDSILKSIEEPESETAFIFLTSNIGNVRRAIRSRCFIRRIEPLSEVHARMMAQAILALNNTEFCSSTLDLVVAAGRGLPREITKAVETLLELGPAKHCDMIAALCLDWPTQVTNQWLRCLESDAPLEHVLGEPCSRDIGEKDQHRRSDQGRMFLLYMHDRIVKGGKNETAYDPALSMLDEQDASRVASEWRKRIHRDRLDEAQVWRQLFELAQVDSYCWDLGRLSLTRG